MKRMPTKQRGHEQASPEGSGDPEQKKKEQNCRYRVNQHICEVVPSRVQTVKLAIQHVRNPG
jgi:hypothetical protein